MTLDVSLKSGDLTFKAEDRKDIEIEFPGLRKNAAEDIFDVSLENTVLKIRENKREKRFGIIILSPGKSGDSADVVIRYPETLRFDGSIVTYSGDLAADILKFSGNCKTYSGDVKINTLMSENLSMEVYSGDLFLQKFNGSIKLNSYSGDVEIKDGEFSDIDINSISGDCEIKGAFSLSADGTIKSISGDVAIDFLSYDGDSTLTIKSLSGDVDLKGSYPEEKIILKSMMKSMKFNPVKMFSDKHNDEIEVEVSMTKKHVQRIIDMMEAGKVTPEEGEKLIRALKG